MYITIGAYDKLNSSIGCVGKSWTKSTEEAARLHSSYYRAREWSVQISDPSVKHNFLASLDALLQMKGAIGITHDQASHPYGAILYRHHLPETYDQSFTLSDDWFQVFLRESESEDNILRLEVITASEKIGSSLTNKLKALELQVNQTR